MFKRNQDGIFNCKVPVICVQENWMDREILYCSFSKRNGNFREIPENQRNTHVLPVFREEFPTKCLENNNELSEIPKSAILLTSVSMITENNPAQRSLVLFVIRFTSFVKKDQCG